MCNGGFPVHRSRYEAQIKKTSGTSKDAADTLVRGIKRKIRKHYSAEAKIRVVLAALGGEESIYSLSRRQGIAKSLIYSGL